jgi:hypothetical protein
MAWAFVTGSGAGVSSALVTQQAVTAGAAASLAQDQRIIVVSACTSTVNAIQTTSVTDQLGNTYSLAARIFDATNRQDLSVFSAPVTVAGIPTATAFYNFQADNAECLLIGIWSGLDQTATPVDVSSSGNSTGTPASTAATTATTAANELVIGGYGDQGNGLDVSAGVGFTERAAVRLTTNNNGLLEDKDSGASGITQTATAATTNVGRWTMLCVVFKLAAVASVALPIPIKVISAVNASVPN